MVVATDGAYRRAKDGNVMSPMGAGVAWQHDHYPPKAVKVGGPTDSSTRAELAAILLALRQANPEESLILLVDSGTTICDTNRAYGNAAQAAVYLSLLIVFPTCSQHHLRFS